MAIWSKLLHEWYERYTYEQFSSQGSHPDTFHSREWCVSHYRNNDTIALDERKFWGPNSWRYYWTPYEFHGGMWNICFQEYISRVCKVEVIPIIFNWRGYKVVARVSKWSCQCVGRAKWWFFLRDCLHPTIWLNFESKFEISSELEGNFTWDVLRLKELLLQWSMHGIPDTLLLQYFYCIRDSGNKGVDDY